MIAQCRGITGLYADLRHQGVGKKTSLFGEPGGVLPLGSSEEGHMLNWRTVGAPDDWTISVWDVDCLEFREIKSTLTKFLLELFDGSSPLYEQHVFEWLKGQTPVFEPYA